MRQMSKKKFRIGELAKALEVKKFVIRFWEKEFDLKSDRSGGGQRYYTQDDFKAFNTIKNLLYSQGYTIAGAKGKLDEVLRSKPVTNKKEESHTQNLAKSHDVAPMQAALKIVEKPVPYIPQEFMEKVQVLKNKLLDLQKNL